MRARAVYANDTAENMGKSNIVHFTVDTTPPTITDVTQTPLEDNVLSEDEVDVNAAITDEMSGVKQTILSYTNGDGTLINIEMKELGGNFWKGTIPKFPYTTDITYRLIVEDNVGNTITTQDLGYSYQYTVIPEFPPFLILPLSMIATLTTAVYIARAFFDIDSTSVLQWAWTELPYLHGYVPDDICESFSFRS